jgi:hypothetical protein
LGEGNRAGESLETRSEDFAEHQIQNFENDI